MGVHGLWELLSPVGRRVSVETLAGKKLAIDASIWMIQFMKAMRDERGEMVRNAHILGFFRRICKLLFLRTKPVFVFDGATPALKRRTVIARRRQRENAQAKIRKTAEKLLLNHLKTMRLKELADNLENQRKGNDDKGKKVVMDKADIAGTTSKTNAPDSKDFDQEALDAMLAASIEAEESGGFMGDASTSGAGVVAEDENGDDDEEMLLPTLQGKVDPAVLAALPPSMQLDLLVQMRERLMAENRQKYQKVNKAPARFSELQIQAYLKTVAFRREIAEVQKAASGRGIGGVQTSRIASEANREFIFSSSFTGNRQSFASSGVEANSSMQSEIPTTHPSAGSVNGVVSTNKSKSAIGSIINEPRKAFNEDLETYTDERGRVRVSKVRAMGIRMTRDLQRNLDLMKEIEQPTIDPIALPESSKLPGTKYQENDDFVSLKTSQGSIPVNGTSIEVSFEDDNEQQFADSDDDVFVRIVAGDDNTSSVKQPTITLSDCEWEEGLPEVVMEERPSISKESEVEWEEGPSDNPELASACEVESKETVSKGDLLEEADFQEAIRRSMDDMRPEKDIDASKSSEDFKDNPNMAVESAAFVPEYVENKPSVTIVAGVHDREDDADEMKINEADNSPSTQLEQTTLNGTDFTKVQVETSCESDLKYDPELPIKDATDDRNCQGETGHGVGLSNESHEENDSQQHEFKTMVIDHVTETLEPKEAVVNVKEPQMDFDIVQNATEERAGHVFSEVGERVFDKSFLAYTSKEQIGITKASLEEEMTNLTKERTDLGDEQRRLERNAESVSGEMFAECQELLQMFGLPYIIAPMEAEAQCAYMELENLVDGVVTDDSDVFLFGARSVYKNIFDDRKYVETYFMKDMETELGLTREKLILMAMLLGSDYTEGISGIGIVNAVEVLNAFPEEDGLHKFREWIESPDPTILGKVDTKKRGSNRNAEGASTANQGSLRSDDDIESVKQIFMDKHRNVSKNWHIPSTFPSEAVVSAYAYPQVDKSTEPFSWGKPDLFVLRKLCSEKFGWGTQKADELLQPVLKEYNKHETQLRLEAFYTFNERFAKIRSKRINKAVKGIAGSKASDDNELNTSNGNKRNKTKQKKGKAKSDLREKSELPIQEKRRGRGRGRTKKSNHIELSGTTSDSDDKQDVDPKHFKGQHEVRKSKRVRKSVTYTNNEDSENDEPAATGADGSNDHEFVPSGARSGEAELDQDWCQNDVTSPGADYLKIGGGFCLDEDEGGKEPCNQPEPEPEPKPEPEPEPAVVGVSEGDVEEDENLTRPVSFLSAIPNLRRKRKKI